MKQEMSSGWSIVIAALPPALLGLVLGVWVVLAVPASSIVVGAATRVPRAAIGGAAAVVQTIIVAVALFLGAGALLGFARRVPAWGYTWATTAISATALWGSILADDVEYLISPLGDLAVLVGLVALLALLAVTASRRSRLDAALVSLSWVASLSLVVLFAAVASPMLRLDLALLTLPCGLFFAWMVVRLMSGRPGFGARALVLSASLATLMIGAYGFAVWRALSLGTALSFMRVLGVIAAIGFAAPLILGELFAGWSMRASRDGSAD